MVAGREACINITMRTFLIFLLLPGLSLSASPAGAGEADLPPCPSSPNCVSSRAPDPSRRVEAIREAFWSVMEQRRGGGPGNR